MDLDLKKTGIIAGGGAISFLLLIAISYFTYPFINPEDVEKIKAEADSMDIRNKFDPKKFNPGAVDSLNDQLADLQLLVDSLKNDEADYLLKIDSLAAALEEEKTKQEQKKSTKTITVPEKLESEEVAKSLLSLDESVLAPIVNLLEDGQLVKLYGTASNRQKEKLLRALEPEKAARILKKVMS